MASTCWRSLPFHSSSPHFTTGRWSGDGGQRARLLLLMTVPLAALSYIYASYYEILFMPVRNVIFFLYLTLGALVYLAAVAVERGRVIRDSLNWRRHGSRRPGGDGGYGP
jgi:hypothetical protein